MNKQVVLQVLKSQLETLRAKANQYEDGVYLPGMKALGEEVKLWLESNVVNAWLHSVNLFRDSIEIRPSDSDSHSNRITIYRRSAYDGSNAYYEVDTCRWDLDSREDCTTAFNYYSVMTCIAHCFPSFCRQYETVWNAEIVRLKSELNDVYNEIFELEREIANCEREIADVEKLAYNSVGFECALKPEADYGHVDSPSAYTYVKRFKDKAFRAQYGRSKWDYLFVNWFKVIEFPKSKHGKVVLEYSNDSTGRRGTVELNKQRYSEFVNEVYSWQTKGAEHREAEIDEMIARWNKERV